jgi:hypothetical protein
MCCSQYPFYLASGRLVGELPLSLDTLYMLRPPSSYAISPVPRRLIESHLTLSHARPSDAAAMIAPYWLCIPRYPRLFKIAEEVITCPLTRDPFFPDGPPQQRGLTSKLEGGGVSVNTPTWLHTMRGGIFGDNIPAPNGGHRLHATNPLHTPIHHYQSTVDTQHGDLIQLNRAYTEMP